MIRNSFSWFDWIQCHYISCFHQLTQILSLLVIPGKIKSWPSKTPQNLLAGIISLLSLIPPLYVNDPIISMKSFDTLKNKDIWIKTSVKIFYYTENVLKRNYLWYCFLPFALKSIPIKTYSTDWCSFSRPICIYQKTYNIFMMCIEIKRWKSDMCLPLFNYISHNNNYHHLEMQSQMWLHKKLQLCFRDVWCKWRNL